MRLETKETIKTTVYTPDSQIRTPRKLLHAMWADLKIREN